jgi:type I restriction enzyme M protein
VDRAKAIITAMESIEKDYTSLAGTLPKAEYTELDNAVLGNLLRVFNDPVLQKANGDIFGRIYEYFLTQFADLKAHDGGEFFTPISIVQLIVNVIEPDHGTVLDPACGSGGMFVQSAHFIERLKKDPTKLATFYGMEKNPTTIRLAKMNLAVHGLEGRINKAITYYDDPHELVGKADFVMANPPFNVDEIDADKIRRDRRLPYGLPGVNKGGKVSNGNYVWISYFDAYLNARGRAGFVMSSQASSAGGEEARLRRDLVKSGHVEAMISIRGNFFYTRTVPCELWFLHKAKSKQFQDKVLMLDARSVHRKVTRKIFDFSPEQLANLTSIVWLYRGQSARFVSLVEQHLDNAMLEADLGLKPTEDFADTVEEACEEIAPFFKGKDFDTFIEFDKAVAVLRGDTSIFAKAVSQTKKSWAASKRDNEALKASAGKVGELAERSHDLARQLDHVSKLFARLVDTAEGELNARDDETWSGREIHTAGKLVEERRAAATVQLNLIRYFTRHARWLQERFPDAKLRDVEGLVKLVSLKDLEENDWSLTPGRYVGVAVQEEDADFDFEETMREIHAELADLNVEATELAATIATNFAELL